jgi:hypothetical protein
MLIGEVFLGVVGYCIFSARVGRQVRRTQFAADSGIYINSTDDPHEWWRRRRIYRPGIQTSRVDHSIVLQPFGNGVHSKESRLMNLAFVYKLLEYDNKEYSEAFVLSQESRFHTQDWAPGTTLGTYYMGGGIYISRSSKVRIFGSHLLLSDQREECRETLCGFLS